jgi:lysophospholipase L1-like esterase
MHERAIIVATVALTLAGVAAGATGASATQTLTVVALGDSIPYGSDCGGCTGYVDLYARRVGKALGRPVKAVNRAEHNNLNSTRLLAQVRNSSSMRAAIARADIVTLTIGHNDTPWVLSDDPCDGSASDTDDQNAIDWPSYASQCSATLAARLGKNITGILGQIKRLRAGKPTLIRVTNFHNDNIGDPGVPRAADSPTKVVVDRFSRAICTAAKVKGVRCADVYHAFNGPNGTRFDGRYVASDHVHPNQRGHTLIAALLAKLGYAPLRP